MDYKYFPHTENDLKAMLGKVGVKDLDGLYAQIPESIRFSGDYELPSAMSELEVRSLFAEPPADLLRRLRRLRPLHAVGRPLPAAAL